MQQNNEVKRMSELHRSAQNKLRAAMLVLLDNASAIALKKNVAFPDFETYQTVVLNAAKQVDTLAGLPAEEKNAWIQVLAEKQTALKAAVNDFILIRQYAAFLEDWLLSQRMLAAAKRMEPEPISAQQLLDIILRNMQALADDAVLYMRYIQITQRSIPLRMTNANFKDYLANQLRHVTLAHTPYDTPNVFHFVHHLKRRYNPADSAHYSTGLCETYKQKLDEIWHADISLNGYAQLDTMALQLNNCLNDQFHAVDELLIMLFDAVNAALILLRYGDQLNQAEKKDPRFALLLSDYKPKPDCPSACPTEAPVGFNAPLNEMIDTLLSSCHDDRMLQYNPADSTEAHSDAYKQQWQQWFNITKMYYDEGDYSDDFPADALTVDEGIAEVIRYIDSHAESYSLKQKRYLRQHFMASLFYPADVKAFIERFAKNYEKLDDESKTAVLIATLYNDTTGEYDHIFGRSEK